MNFNYNQRILVYDVPLIFETKSHKDYNLILLANCDSEYQKRRVLKRDRISNSLFHKINESQLSFNEKIKFKPKIINTNHIKLVIFLRIIILLIKISIEQRIENGKKKKVSS